MSRTRYTPPECVGVGDKIRATFEVDDMTITHEGTVADIQSLAGGIHAYVTGSNAVLFYRERGHSVMVEMLQQYQPLTEDTLF